ncbi:MAG: hypothetical protein PHE56_01295 [Bacteroidales bacterium]|jgi:hypothetical protein|nr:hypothetical protein [Bacteroidales bacterium]
MKKLIYNTPNGQLTVNADGSVILEFQNLYMQLNNDQFSDFVGFVNANKHKLAGNVKEQAYDSFYHTVLRNMKIELAGEFLKLVNAPVFSPDDKYDIFDSLKELKSDPKAIFSRNDSDKSAFINAKAICPN